MSKALPIAVGVILSGVALVPIYYASQSPATKTAASAKASPNASGLQKISYALGYEVAHQTPPELEIDSFVAGIRDAHARKDSAYSEEELQKAFEQYQQEMQKKQATDSKEAQSINNAFLQQNQTKPGVKTTKSGLQYVITKEGTGKSPSLNSTVKVHYTGKLVDGKVFDSSVERGEPLEFKLNQVIPGWTEGLQLMKEGGKATLFIPSELGYGPQGAPGGAIPPNSTLIFDVELIQVK